MTNIRDRIKELRRVPARELTANPKNWRRHPVPQQNAMRAVLEEIGYAGALLCREVDGKLQLIDGHLRAEITPNEQVPVLVLDVNEEEADKLLATYDPLSAMAEKDEDALRSLLQGIQFDQPLLKDWTSSLFDLVPDADNQRDGSDPRPTLAERFGVPPFSVLDARQGYWQERKRAWLALGIESELGRAAAPGGRSETGSPIARQRNYAKG